MSTWRALLIWSLGATFFCFAFVQRVAPSVMVSELMRDLALGAAVLGNLSAFYFYAYAGMQIPIGLLMDRHGPRRVMAAFVLLCGAGNLIFAMTTSVELAYLGRLLIGLGASAGWVGTLTLATHWLPERRFALLSGLGQVFGMMGAVAGQAPLGIAVGAYGWRATLFAMAAFSGLLAILIWFLVRERPRGPAAGAPALAPALARALRNPQTWLNALIGLALTGPMLSFAGLWAVPYLSQVHALDRATAGAVSSMTFIGWAIGAPLIGWLADRIGRRRVLILAGAGVATLTQALIVYLPTVGPASLVVLLLLNGAAGSSMILTFGLARDSNPPETMGAVLGFVNTAVVGSGALLQPLIGALLDMSWDGATLDGARIYSADAYRMALSVLPFCAAAGIVGGLLVSERKFVDR